MKIDDETIAAWCARLERARADEGWRKAWQHKEQRRREVLPAMNELLADFLAERVSIEELRSQWDRKTRKEWDYFGFKGFGGAMFRNMLVKHLPAAAGAAQVLRDVLPKPVDDASARTKLEDLRRYLRTFRDAGELTETQATEANIPFFASGWWHIQDPSEWPPYYASVPASARRSPRAPTAPPCRTR